MSALEIDKEQHYGKYMAQETITNGRTNRKNDWRDDLDKKLRHKALDIPIDPNAEVDPLNVDNRRTWTGIGWKELLVIAGTGLGAVGLYKLGGQQATTPVQPTPPTVAASQPKDVTQKFDVVFYDKDGNQIVVPRAPQK